MKRLVGFALLFLAFACKKEEVVTDFSLDSEVQVQLEVSDTKQANLVEIKLVCKTEKEYGCANYTILTQKEKEIVQGDEAIQITFLGVQSPDICATAFGPAYTEIELGSFGQGVYMLHLNTPLFTNKGLLEITEEEVKLYFPQQDGIEILTPAVQR